MFHGNLSSKHSGEWLSAFDIKIVKFYQLFCEVVFEVLPQIYLNLGLDFEWGILPILELAEWFWLLTYKKGNCHHNVKFFCNL